MKHIIFFLVVLIGLGLASCHSGKLVKKEFSQFETLFTEINRYFDNRLSRRDTLKFYSVSTYNRDYLTYCRLHYFYMDCQGIEKLNFIDKYLKYSCEIDYGRFIENIQDSFYLPIVENMLGRPVIYTNDRLENKTYVFSPLVPTKTRNVYLAPVEFQKERDPYWYIFRVKIKGKEIEILDYEWSDFIYCGLEEEEDYFMKEYNKRRGK